MAPLRRRNAYPRSPVILSLSKDVMLNLSQDVMLNLIQHPTLQYSILNNQYSIPHHPYPSQETSTRMANT